MDSRHVFTTLVLALAACGDGGTEPPPVVDARYVSANEIYTGDSSTTYINVLSSLDDVVIDPGRATEFAGGRATIEHAGSLGVTVAAQPATASSTKVARRMGSSSP
jgi:hypothetical protein